MTGTLPTIHQQTQNGFISSKTLPVDPAVRSAPAAGIEVLRDTTHLIGAAAMMRPIVETLGLARPWRSHYSSSNFCTGCLPKFGYCSRRRRIACIKPGGRRVCRRRCGAGRTRRQCRCVVSGFPQGLPPPIQGTATDLECIAGSGHAMVFLEGENFESLFCIVSHSIPTMPDFSDPGKPPDSVTYMSDLQGFSSCRQECQMFLSLCSAHEPLSLRLNRLI